MNDTNIPESPPVTAEEKKRNLFLKQKETLDLFLERGAISQTQYDKSLGDLTEKMGFRQELLDRQAAQNPESTET